MTIPRSIAAVLLGGVVACSNTESHTATDAGVPSAAVMPTGSRALAVPAPADVAAPPADATRTASGLVTKVLTPGTGKVHPGPDDRAVVNYTGWTSDGHMFDGTSLHGSSMTIPLKAVIPGWSEGLQLMVAGEKRRMWIPSNLAYGDKPRRGAPGGDLVFDIELVDVLIAPKVPAVPEDVRAAPANATKTASGLAYRVLTPGAGKAKPTAASEVTVDYSGWTPDGKMFDSSVMGGKPAHLAVTGVIKGWTEGLQLMSKGEKARFWVPSGLAYGDAPTGGQPAGMLVFDIELIDFQ
jgi:FKBP-type peptidyl-prolyl cis-trans isomerase